MSVNVGSIDRIVRMLIGITAIVFVFIGPIADTGVWGWERIALSTVGLIMVGTSAIKFCPIYRAFGLRTC